MPVPPPSSRPLERKLRKAEVFDWLFAAILDGTLSPGERIRDSELEIWFGVSRTPIRLAVDRLEELGLIESRPNRFTRVAPATPDLIPGLIGAMCGLWTLAVRLTLERLTLVDENECRRLLDRAAVACRDFDSGSPDGAIRAVETMREALFFFSQHSGNPLLEAMVVKTGASLRFQLGLHGNDLDWSLFRAVFERLHLAVDQRDPEIASDVFRRLREAAGDLAPDVRPVIDHATAGLS